MENASKALLMAGGVLLALMIVGLLVLLTNSLTSLNDSDDKTKAAEQLAKFNKEYESYNKKLLYGTDLITVVNKAIENNKHMDTESNANNRYYVNVIFTTKNEYKTEIITLNKTTGKSTLIEDTDYTLVQNETYKLGNFDDTDSFEMNSNIINFFNSSTKTTVTETDEEKKTTIPTLTNFKSTIFRCIGIEYADGRVHEITFEEITT